jgi:hypothetical protein
MYSDPPIVNNLSRNLARAHARLGRLHGIRLVPSRPKVIVAIAVLMCTGLFTWPSRAFDARELSTTAYDNRMDLILAWEDKVGGPRNPTSLSPAVVFSNRQIIVSIAPGQYPPPGDLHEGDRQCVGTQDPSVIMACRRRKSEALASLSTDKYISAFISEGKKELQCSQIQKRVLWSYRLCAAMPLAERGHFRLDYELDRDDSGVWMRRVATVDVTVANRKCSVKIVSASRNYPAHPEEMVLFEKPINEVCNIAR